MKRGYPEKHGQYQRSCSAANINEVVLIISLILDPPYFGASTSSYHRHYVERLLRFQAKPKILRITGSAMRSDVWLQVPDGTELGGLGAVIASAAVAGCYEDYRLSVNATVHFSCYIDPDASQANIYRAGIAHLTS